VFAHACKLGLEGIVAKRRDRPYRSGRSPDWIKVKNSTSRMVIQSNRACKFVSGLCSLKSTDWCWPEYLAVATCCSRSSWVFPQRCPRRSSKG
jgi:hypothetical protein